MNTGTLLHFFTYSMAVCYTVLAYADLYSLMHGALWAKSCGTTIWHAMKACKSLFKLTRGLCMIKVFVQRCSPSIGWHVCRRWEGKPRTNKEQTVVNSNAFKWNWKSEHQTSSPPPPDVLAMNMNNVILTKWWIAISINKGMLENHWRIVWESSPRTLNSECTPHNKHPLYTNRSKLLIRLSAGFLVAQP